MPISSHTLLTPLWTRLAAAGCDLGEAERAFLAEAFSEPRRERAGTDLAREGSTTSVSTLLLTGLTIRYNVMADGQRHVTAVHVPGDFVDLHSYVLAPMDHSVATLVESVVVTIAHRDLDALLLTFPRLTKPLWHLTLRDAAIHRKWLALMGEDARTRLAHLLCELDLRAASSGQSPAALTLTQSDLADATGMTTVHVNRTLQSLRNQGLVDWTRGGFVIRDAEGLRQVAGFDDTYLRSRVPEIL